MADSLEKRLADLKDESRDLVAKGMAELAALSPDRFPFVAALAVHTAVAPHALQETELGQVLGVPEEQAGRILLAAVVLISAIKDPKASELLVRAKIADQTTVPILERFLQELRQRQKEIEDTISQQKLAETVLPAFHDLELTVDVRFGFEGDEIVKRAPVAIAYLSTDAREQRLWFQISKPQMAGLIRILQRTLTRLEKAEELVKGSAEKGS